MAVKLLQSVLTHELFLMLQRPPLREISFNPCSRTNCFTGSCELATQQSHLQSVLTHELFQRTRAERLSSAFLQSVLTHELFPGMINKDTIAKILQSVLTHELFRNASTGDGRNNPSIRAHARTVSLRFRERSYVLIPSIRAHARTVSATMHSFYSVRVEFSDRHRIDMVALTLPSVTSAETSVF